MKTFLVASAILIMLTGAVIWNGVWLQREFTLTVDAALRLPETVPKKAGKEPDPLSLLVLQWEKTEKAAALTVPANRLESISRALSALHAAGEAKDDSAYRCFRAELLLLLQETRRTEAFSAGSFF